MGHQLVAAVYANWPGLPHRAMRLLAYMANVALDEGQHRTRHDGSTVPTATYFGGRDGLTHALGFTQTSDTAYRAVRAALRELKAAGAVDLVTAGKPGANSVYLIHMAPSKAVRHMPPMAVREAPERRYATYPDGGTTRTARQEGQEVKSDGTRNQHLPEVTTDRAREAHATADENDLDRLREELNRHGQAGLTIFTQVRIELGNAAPMTDVLREALRRLQGAAA